MVFNKSLRLNFYALPVSLMSIFPEIDKSRTYNMHTCIYNVTISLPETILLIGAIVNDCVVAIMLVISTREEMGRGRVEKEVVAVE